MVCGDIPFDSDEKICGGARLFFSGSVSHDCQDLVAQCLRLDPAQRIDLEEILCHPWMTRAFADECPIAAVRSAPATLSHSHKPSLNSVGSSGGSGSGGSASSSSSSSYSSSSAAAAANDDFIAAAAAHLRPMVSEAGGSIRGVRSRSRLPKSAPTTG